MQNKTSLILSISAVLAFLMQLTSASVAQGSREWMQCLGLEAPIIDNVIDGCTAVIRSGLEARERLATAFDNRGVAYKQQGQYERALQDYGEAIRLNPSNANAYNNRGIICRIKGEYDRALADYDEAIWLKKGNFPAATMNSRSRTSRFYRGLIHGAH